MGFEESAKNAQSEDCYEPKTACEPKTAEELNLVRRIEIRTNNVIKTLNTVEDLINRLNKQLLPSSPKQVDETKMAEKRPPQGWLEYHLEDLDCAFRRAGQIYNEVTRLMQATKTKEKVNN